MPCIESWGKLCVSEAEARGRPGGRSGRPGRPADGSSHFLTAEHDSGQTDFNFAETYLTLKRGIMKCNPSDSPCEDNERTWQKAQTPERGAVLLRLRPRSERAQQRSPALCESGGGLAT